MQTYSFISNITNNSSALSDSAQFSASEQILYQIISTVAENPSFPNGFSAPHSHTAALQMFFSGLQFQHHHVPLLFYFLFLQLHKSYHFFWSALPDRSVFFPFVRISHCVTAEAIYTEVMSYSALFIFYGGKLLSKGRAR